MRLGKGQARGRFGAGLQRRPAFGDGCIALGFWDVVCRRPNGNIRWQERFQNLVVNEGLDELLNAALANQTQHTAWYVGLLATSPSPAAAWTKTEVGAADFVAYDEATLQTWTPNGAASSQSVTNSSSKATFTISTNSSVIGGAYLASANTKAVEGGSAIIYAAGAFTGGDKSADDGDTLEVTATFTTADDGV